LIYIGQEVIANVLFAISLLSLLISLFFSLIEIGLSTKAIELELSDMDDLEDPSMIDFIKSKF